MWKDAESRRFEFAQVITPDVRGFVKLGGTSLEGWIASTRFRISSESRDEEMARSIGSVSVPWMKKVLSSRFVCRMTETYRAQAAEYTVQHCDFVISASIESTSSGTSTPCAACSTFTTFILYPCSITFSCSKSSCS